MTKVIGIIGGMGPAATLDLLAKIYSYSKAERDQGHVRVLADIDPAIPDRTEAILTKNTEGLIAHLLKNARGLEELGADLLAMPCNTAHAFAGQLQAKLSVPIISIIDVTVDNIARRGLKNVGIMATDGTLAAGLYLDQFRSRGIAPIYPRPREQALLMEAIYAFKGGELCRSAEAAKEVLGSLLAAGAEEVVAACTEVPLLLAGMEGVVDPTGLLAERLVELAMGG